MISQIDEALRELIRAEALNGSSDVEVVLDAPTKDWAARRNAPTVDVYLYDIREDLRRRENGWIDRRTPDGLIRERSARMFKFSYLVTAWTQRPEDEHRLLSALMSCFLRHDAMPDGSLPVSDGDARLTVALPPPEDRAFADVWTALGGELKPSLDVVVIAPMAAGNPEAAGPPVTDGAYIDLTDITGRGADLRRHRHAAPAASAAASARLAALGGGSGTASAAPGMAIGKGRTMRDPKRQGAGRADRPRGGGRGKTT